MGKRGAKGWGPGAVGAALWILGGTGAAAQDVDLSRPLTVDECVRVAMGESPVIGAAEAQLQQADGTARMALRAVLPTVAGSFVAAWAYPRFVRVFLKPASQ